MSGMKNEEIEKSELYDSYGVSASIWDICAWWIEAYPEDVFKGGSSSDDGIALVVQIRECAKSLLALRGSQSISPAASSVGGVIHAPGALATGLDKKED